MRFVLIVILLAVSAWGQKSVGNTSTTGTEDQRTALHTLPYRTGTGAPTGSNCTGIGEVYFQSDATPGQNLWSATATGTPCTWTLSAGGVFAQLGTFNNSANASFTIPDADCGYRVTLSRNGSQLVNLPSGATNGCYNWINCTVSLASYVCHVAGSPLGTQGAGYTLHTGQQAFFYTDGTYWYGSLVVPTGSSAAVQKGDSAGGFQDATAGTDYAPATSGSAILKGNAAGGFLAASAGTDYLGPTSGSAVQKASSGGLTASVATDIIGLFSTCSGTQYLGADGSCHSNTQVCNMSVGDASGLALSDAQLGPQYSICEITAASTLIEISINSDPGQSPSVIVGRRRCTTYTAGTCSIETVANVLSSALAVAAGYGKCSNIAGTTGIDGGTTCAATLQNTGLNAGDRLEFVSGTANGAKLVVVHAVFRGN